MKQYGTVNTNVASRVSQATWVQDSTFLLGSCVFLCLWVHLLGSYLICEMINNHSTFLVECLWGLRESVYVKNPCRVLVLVFSTEQIFLQFFLTSLHSSPDFLVLLRVTEAHSSFLSVANVSHESTLSCWLTHRPQHPRGPPPPPHVGPLGSWWMLFQWLVDCGLYSHPQDNLSLEGVERCISKEQQPPMGTCGFLAWAIYKPAPKV